MPSKHPLYQTWHSIVRRCLWSSHKDYPNYGGRGITLFPEWANNSLSFFDWVEINLGQRPVNLTLDRIDVNGNYEPGNLRWATAIEQRANRRYKEFPKQCSYGHDLTPENIFTRKSGKRSCRLCGNISNRKSRAKRKLEKASEKLISHHSRGAGTRFQVLKNTQR